MDAIIIKNFIHHPTLFFFHSKGATMNTPLSEDIIRTARACGIERVILFGSRARGDNRARSDIEKRIGKSVVSPLNAKDKLLLEVQETKQIENKD